ncbi:DUF2461 domain-containing protein [Leifsonia sp. ZF2019]|uniref:DUF2461 domain-containing protein n=1 Tax=Leifsonia sp. ZF2019 TaxID=2781978 RepID=UPI001CBAAA8F|nr:DUF2461 domain-containing protein [Leifsonia sp. ZF2019]UAJ79238.1 DUF2461 domain-containing protein [Leifsonia sp. ZF2019]
MHFDGFDDDAITFYRELTLRNDRAFWLENRDRYENRVAGPMHALADALAPEFGAARLFRPYRDVRFSRHKSPYKLHAGLTFERGGYVQVSAEGVAAGAGVYLFDRDQLERYRRAVDAPATGAALERAVAAVEAAGHAIVVPDRLKTAPRGFRPEAGEPPHPRAELLRYKGLVAWTDWGIPDWFATAAAADEIARFLRESEPVSGWLRDTVR